jgi:hypothetical protein
MKRHREGEYSDDDRGGKRWVGPSHDISGSGLDDNTEARRVAQHYNEIITNPEERKNSTLLRLRR